MRMTSLLIGSLFLVGCGDDGGSNSGIDAPGGVDSSVDIDAAPTADAPTAPAMITISGVATERTLGGSPVIVGATIAAYRATNEATPVAMATTDAQGKFTMTISTGGFALEGYLKATKAGMVVTYLYAPAPIAMDMANVPINMVTPGNYGTLYTITQVGEQANTGIVAMVVTGANTMTPVAGAMMTSMPSGTYKYNASGIPSSTATVTGTDGVAYFLNAPLGTVKVGAQSTGMAWQSHGVKVFTSSLTTTLVVPQ